MFGSAKHTQRRQCSHCPSVGLRTTLPWPLLACYLDPRCPISLQLKAPLSSLFWVLAGSWASTLSFLWRLSGHQSCLLHVRKRTGGGKIEMCVSVRPSIPVCQGTLRPGIDGKEKDHIFCSWVTLMGFFFRTMWSESSDGIRSDLILIWANFKSGSWTRYRSVFCNANSVLTVIWSFLLFFRHSRLTIVKILQ